LKFISGFIKDNLGSILEKTVDLIETPTLSILFDGIKDAEILINLIDLKEMFHLIELLRVVNLEGNFSR
jgi:hypothetical protein